MNLTRILIGFISILFSGHSYSLFNVSLTEVPERSSDPFVSQISGADFNDKTPNPCFQVEKCVIAGYAIDKSDYPLGPGQRGAWEKPSEARYQAAFESETLGDLARSLREKGELYITVKDMLVGWLGKEPIFCLYAGLGNYRELIPGTLVSNCAEAPPPIAHCTASTGSIDIDWGNVSLRELTNKNLTFSVKCDKPTDISISVSGVYIPLNADIDSRAEFNFGEGWTGKATKKIEGEVNVNVEVRLVGVTNPGEYRGSSIIVIAMD